MKPGELRRFKDSTSARELGSTHADHTFMVLRVCIGVDILLDGRVEADLGYFWVKDSSEALDEAR